MTTDDTLATSRAGERSLRSELETVQRHFAQLHVECAELRKRNSELHRRCQQAEAAVAKFKRKWDEHGGPRGGSFGRALLASYCESLEADLDAARRDVAVLREALTRLLSWRESDFDQPADIAREALAATAVRTDALPGAPAAPNMAHLYARSNALTVAMQALEQIVKESERHGPAWPSHVARNALDHIGAPNAPGARTDALPPP